MKNLRNRFLKFFNYDNVATVEKTSGNATVKFEDKQNLLGKHIDDDDARSKTLQIVSKLAVTVKSHPIPYGIPTKTFAEIIRELSPLRIF